MKLTCPDCSKPVPAADVNVKLGIGKCLGCDAVFSLVDQIGLPMGRLRTRVPIAPPKKFKVDDFGPDLTLSWRWYTHAVWFLLIFAVVWDGFLIVWYGAAIGQLMAGKGGNGIWFMLLFPILHLLVGLGITYAVILSFVNRTMIRLAGGELSVWHGPLPTWGNCRMLSSDISQLFCSETVSRTKRGYNHSYSLIALLQNGERVTLLSNLQDSFEALFLEQFLEDKLKIRDERVPGSFRA